MARKLRPQPSAYELNLMRRGLPYPLPDRLSHLGLGEFATRHDVVRKRHLIPRLTGTGPVSLQIIDEWLAPALPPWVR